MKEEVLSDIPQQNTAQSQSMYEQLRRSSQKWFGNSHQRGLSSTIQCREPQLNYKMQRTDLVKEMGGQEINQSSKMRLMILMREQIQISCKMYADRMNVIIKEQARSIKVLGNLLNQNQIELKRKDQLIQHLKIISTSKIENIHQSDSNKEELNTIDRKIQELTMKMNNILRQITEVGYKEKQLNRKCESVQLKIRNDLKQKSAGLIQRVQLLKEDLDERLDRLEKSIQMSQCASKINRRPSFSEKGQMTKITNTLISLQGEIQEMRGQIQVFGRKKYSYQNYKIEELQDRLLHLSQLLSERQIKSTKSLKVNLKSSQLTRTESNMCAESSKTRFMNKYRSLISNRRPSRDIESSGSSSESQVEETQMERSEDNLQRLIRILRQMKIKTPFKIQIDQTGYAKSLQTGMYLVDGTGDGFQFSTWQLSELQQRGLIQI